MKWIVFGIVGKVAYRVDGMEDIEINSVMDQLRGVGAAEISSVELVDTDDANGPELTVGEGVI